ncbi:MAG: hypothetical protein WCL08_08500, partial [Verrucomicrobiota bacterium]
MGSRSSLLVCVVLVAVVSALFTGQPEASRKKSRHHRNQDHTHEQTRAGSHYTFSFCCLPKRPD